MDTAAADAQKGRTGIEILMRQLGDQSALIVNHQLVDFANDVGAQFLEGFELRDFDGFDFLRQAEARTCEKPVGEVVVRRVVAQRRVGYAVQLLSQLPDGAGAVDLGTVGQAEDEIAGVCSTIGASFAGNLAIQ